MDVTQRGALNALVEALVFSGRSPLDAAQVQQLKQLCRSSDSMVRSAYEQLMMHLEYDHAQVRLAALELIDVLFTRSALFRTLLAPNMRTLAALTVGGIDDEQLLPEPARYAALLRARALCYIKAWRTKFATTVKQVDLAYTFLKDRLRVDFDEAADQAAVKLPGARPQPTYNPQRLTLLRREVDGQEPEIQRIVQALTTAMALLVPRPDDAAFLASNTVDRKAQASATMSGADLLRLTEDAQADEAVEENGDEEDEEEGEEDGEGPAAAELAANRAENAATNGSAAAAAAASAAPAVSISSTMTIVEDEGNAPVVSQLLENGRLLRNKYAPLMDSWLSTAEQCRAREADTQRLRSLKADITSVLQRYERIRVVPMNPPADRKADDDEDDDFVDVPGLPPAESGSTAAAVSAAVSASASARPRAAAGGPQPARKQEDGDVTYVSVAGRKLATDRLRVGGAMFTRRHENEVMSDTRVQRQNGSADKSSKDKRTSSEVDEAARARRREELLARAPVVPYTPELETWGREEEIASVPVAGVLDVNCNWQTGSRAEISTQQLALHPLVTQREYLLPSGQELTARKCLAPLEGKFDAKGAPMLCQRKEVRRCPVHGPIVDRDPVTGQVLNPGVLQPREGGAAAAAAGGKQAKKRKAHNREANLVPIQRGKRPASQLEKRLRNTVIHSIDPTLDKLRKEKFMNDWNAP